MEQTPIQTNPKVSVISPMYNVEKYVGECVRSLLEQDFTSFEAIFVDDGSTDASLAVAKAAAASDSRFTFLQQENSGQSVARNKALNVARGDFVLFLDADDSYMPYTLSRLMGVQAEADLDAVFFAAATLYEDRGLALSHSEPHLDRVGEHEVLNGFQMLEHFHTTNSFRPSACMYTIRRSLLNAAGLRFREGMIHEDLLFTLQVFPLLERCVFLAEPLYLRLMRHGSTMTSPRSLKNVDGLFKTARFVEAQLDENSEVWPQGYVDAMCERLAVIWDTLAHDAAQLGEATMLEYRNDLSRKDRISFNVHVLEAGKNLHALERHYTESTTFRVGRAIMAGPTWLKDRFSKPLS